MNLRELLESKVAEWVALIHQDGADLEDVADTIQVALADDGVVVAIDDVVDVVEAAHQDGDPQKSSQTLVQGLVAAIED